MLEFCHSSPFGGHYGTQRTGRKVLDCGLYWPTIFKELEEIRLAAYENSRFYKEKTKKFHDQKLVARKDFKVGQKVLLYKSKLGDMSGKLCSTWEGPYIVTEVFPYGAVEIKEESSARTFKVNGHRLRYSMKIKIC